jgi:hypothetical protein
MYRNVDVEFLQTRAERGVMVVAEHDPRLLWHVSRVCVPDAPIPYSGACAASHVGTNRDGSAPRRGDMTDVVF